jgi:hypothetical protein
LDKRSGKKAPLKDNDFLASIWRGFLYTRGRSMRWPADREQRARIIGEWLQTETRYLA